MTIFDAPAPFDQWDPLVQRGRSSAPRPASFKAPPPASLPTSAAPPSRVAAAATRLAAPPSRGSAPPSRVAAPSSRGSSRAPGAPPSLATPAPVAAGTPFVTPAPKPGTPATAQEEEVASVTLAWRLQQEEQAAFLSAMRSTQSPRRSSAGGDSAPAQMDLDDSMRGDEDEDDASLQLAMRLQQEELRWQQLQSQRSIGGAAADLDGGDDDASLQLALRLQQEEAEGEHQAEGEHRF